MIRASLTSGALAVVLLASPAAAQQTATTLTPNQRIKIALPVEGGSRRVAGTVVEVRGDTMVLEVHGNQERIALSSIRELEASRGRRSRLRTGALGAALGTAAGAGLGIYLRENSHQTEVLRYREVCTTPGNPSTCARELYRTWEKAPVFTTIGLSLAGTGLGALIGAVLPGDRWEVVPLPASSGSRPAVSLSVNLSH